VGLGLALGIGSFALTAAGTGLSVYGSMQQAGAQRGVASANAEIMRKNAELELRANLIEADGEIYAAGVDKQNAQISKRSGQIDELNAGLEDVGNTYATATAVGNATTNARLYRMDSALARKNASTLNAFGRTIEAQGRERVARMREDGRRAMGVVRNRVAKSGLVMEGSPLIVASENAANIELAAQDAVYESRMNAREADQQAQALRFGAKRSLLSARQERHNAKAALKTLEISKVGVAFKIAGAKLSQEAADVAANAADFRASQGEKMAELARDKYEVSLEEAGISKAAGFAQARATEMAAIGTAISGASSIAGTAGSYFGSASIGDAIGNVQYYTGTTPKATAV